MQPSQSQRGVRLFTTSAFFCMVIIGFLDNLKGPAMPELLKELDFTYSQGGAIIMTANLGYFAATLLTGVLADLVGRRIVLLAAGCSTFLGVAGFITFHTFWGVALSFFVVGLGAGGFDLGGNSTVVDLQPKEKGRYLSLISVARGISAMVSPMVAGFFIAGALGWRPGYLIVMVLALIMVVFASLTKYPKGASSFKEGMNFKTLGKQITMPKMRWLYLLLFAYIAFENSMASWLPAYLQAVHAVSVRISSEAISLFYAGQMAGRLIGSMIFNRIGYLRALLIAVTGGLACLIIGLSGPSGMTFFLSLSGLFFSMVFPVTTALTTDMHRENVNSIIGLLFAFSGLGGAIGPWLIGLLIDGAGIRTGFSLVIAYITIVLVSILVIRKQGKIQAAVETA